jgi:hypothetical protein
VLDTLLVRLTFPVVAVGLALTRRRAVGACSISSTCPGGWPWSRRSWRSISNFGFNLPWWDRLLGTYRPQPRDGHDAMTISIEQFRTRGDLRLDRMLMQPLRGPASGYPINREPEDP